MQKVTEIWQSKNELYDEQVVKYFCFLHVGLGEEKTVF